jgi:beta-glucanase (GH16 family)
MQINQILKIQTSLIIINLILSAGCFAQDAAVGQRAGWHLLWQDEFSGNSLDTAKWRAEDAALTKNNELQYYTPEDVLVKDGMLVLRSEKKIIGNRRYSSGLVETRNKFALQYGRVETRAKVPKGQGLLPAHWMLPTSGLWPPEIDIMEVLGNQPNVVHMTEHWGIWPDRKKQGAMFVGQDFSQDFHEFAIEWNKDSVKWFVDGIQHLEVKQYVPHEPFYIILNTAVGGNWPGSPNSQTKFPQEHQIDYIRVYAPEIPGQYYLNCQAEHGRIDAKPNLIVYSKNRKVRLKAEPSIGYKFSHWSKDLQGSRNPVNIRMDQHKQIIANFILDEKAWPKLSAKKKSWASSKESFELSARHAVDDKLKTRWASKFSEPQWLRIDLGKKCLIKAVRLSWEVAFARAYKLKVSNDDRHWKTIYSTENGQGSMEEIKRLNAKARYLEVYCTKRGTEFGCSLWECEVFGKEL